MMEDKQVREELFKKHCELVEESEREAEVWDSINEAKTVADLKAALLAYVGERPEVWVQKYFKAEDIPARSEIPMISDDDELETSE